jgi:hypothetical protein
MRSKMRHLTNRQIFMTKTTPKPTQRIVAAKAPAAPKPEIELPASPADSSLSTTTVESQIRGEDCAADFGAPPRLTLVAGTSALAEYVTPGQWAINNNLGAPVALGTEIEILPISPTKWWLQDYGQDDGSGAPVRFLTDAEVRDYGGTTMREPGKVTFSRSIELRVLITDNEKADQTYLRVLLSGASLLAAVYEAARTAYRSVGVGLNLYWHNTGELPHQRRWKLGVVRKENRLVKSFYFVPTLTRGEPVSAAERVELEKMIDRQLFN